MYTHVLRVCMPSMGNGTFGNDRMVCGEHRWAIALQYIEQLRICLSISRCLPQQFIAIAHPWWRVGAGGEPVRKAAKSSAKAGSSAGDATADGEEGPCLVQRMNAYEVEELLPAELIRQFVSYARQHCHPKLTHEAKLVIKEFYLQLRQKAAMQKAVCITVRKPQRCMVPCGAGT